MSKDATEIPRPEAEPFTSAKGVAWVLSGAAIGSLVVGIAAVEFLGPFSKSPRLERTPAVVPDPPARPEIERPTVLPSMSAQDVEGGESLLFEAPPGEPAVTPGADAPYSTASRPEDSLDLR